VYTKSVLYDISKNIPETIIIKSILASWLHHKLMAVYTKKKLNKLRDGAFINQNYLVCYCHWARHISRQF